MRRATPPDPLAKKLITKTLSLPKSEAEAHKVYEVYGKPTTDPAAQRQYKEEIQSRTYDVAALICAARRANKPCDEELIEVAALKFLMGLTEKRKDQIQALKDKKATYKEKLGKIRESIKEFKQQESRSRRRLPSPTSA